MDCVEVCPVDCFYEGENMLVIHPDECIQQEVHELGPRKTKRGIKISRRGTKSDPPRRMKFREIDLTCPRLVP
jgi:formate hydrogenlyase subunit 6/NADH:ubiquinone oxidoreductase subunit I